MFKKVTAVGLTAAALMLSAAPVAHADEPVRTCRFAATAVGTSYTGFAVGAVVHGGGGPVSITCFVQKNSAVVATTPTGTGTAGAAVTAGAISFSATPFDFIELCTTITTTHGTDTRCFETISQEVPFTIVDLVCAVTGIIGANGGINILGQIVIDLNGDVFLAGIKVIDCAGGSTPLIIRFGG